MRGYIQLKKYKRTDFFRKIKSNLVDSSFLITTSNSSKLIFGSAFQNSELVVRQLMLDRYASKSLYRSLLYCIGKSKSLNFYPLPKLWINVLKQNGIKVNSLASLISWLVIILIYWAYGIFQIFKIIFKSFILINKKLKVKYVYFHGLNEENLPRLDCENNSYDVCSWYIQSPERLHNVNLICHSVVGYSKINHEGMSIEFLPLPYELPKSIKKLLSLLVWGFFAALISLFDILRGRWWHAFVLSEAVRLKSFELTNTVNIAEAYYFHYSGSVYRPMWTYSADQKGSKIFCYFYSSSEQIKLPSGYESQKYEWGAASWPNYLVWDKWQAQLISRDIPYICSIKIVGPIWFSSSPLPIPNLSAKSIAIFDMQPHRKSMHFGTSTLADYHVLNSNVSIRFINDIHTVLTELGFNVVIKKKREIGHRAEKKYIRFLDELKNYENVTLVNPDISAIKVIENCMAVISMPFTSTALYPRDMLKPSIYYDPTGFIQKDDRGAHDIPILSGIDELREWVKSLKNNVVS